MSKRSAWLLGLMALVTVLGATSPVRADADPDFYDYDAIIDSDNNPLIGCDVALHDANFNGTVTGVEYILTARVLRFSNSASVDKLFLRQCVSGSTFGAPFEVDVDWPVGLQTGVPVPAPYNSADVVEFYVPLDAIGNPATMRLGFHATRTASLANDVLLTTNGGEGGLPIIFPPGTSAAPALSKVALGLCAILLSASALWVMRRRSAIATAFLSVSLALSVAATAWAVTIVLDGNVGDWVGIQAAGIDNLGDSSINDPAEDIAQAFVTADAQNLYFRMDQVNLAPTVCGDGIIQSGEYCEETADCTGGGTVVFGANAASTAPCSCQNCQCVGSCDD